MGQMPRGCRLGECQLRGPVWRWALSLATSTQQVLVTMDAGGMGERAVLPPVAEPAGCLTAICLACRDPQALGLPSGWAAGPFGSQSHGGLPIHHLTPHTGPHMASLTADLPLTGLLS